MSEKKSNNTDNHVSQMVPESERQGWVSVMLVWMGCMICVTSILVGQSLVMGLSFTSAVIASVIGYGLVLIIAIFQGMQSADLGRPTVVVAEPAYGPIGSKYIFSFVIAIALIGWFGIQTSVAGSSLQALLAMVNVNISLKVAMVLSGVLMLSCAIYGFKVMEKLNTVAVPLLIVVLVWAFFNAVRVADFSAILSYQPENPMSILSGISIVIGGFIVGAVIAGDFTRFNKNRKDTIKSAAFGIVPAGVALVLIGAFLAIASGDPTSNLEQVLISHIPFPALALVTLFLATWTTNVSNAYSAGIALVNGFNLEDSKRPLVTAISGLVGTILAVMGILDSIVLFLVVLTNLVTPIAGVMIGDYWITNKGKAEGYMEKTPRPALGIVSWVLGALPGIIVTTLSVVNPEVLGNHPLLTDASSFIGLFISLAVYLIGVKLEAKKVEPTVAKEV